MKYIYLLLHILWIASWLKSAHVFHVMCKIFGLVKHIFGALILYDFIVTRTVSASNKKSSVHEIDNEKRAMELLNVSRIPCMDLLNKQGENSLIKFNVSYIIYFIYCQYNSYAFKNWSYFIGSFQLHFRYMEDLVIACLGMQWCCQWKRHTNFEHILTEKF